MESRSILRGTFSPPPAKTAPWSFGICEKSCAKENDENDPSRLLPTADVLHIEPSEAILAPYATGASTRSPSCAKGGHFPGLLEPRWAERALPAPEAQVQGASTRKVDVIA